MKRQRLRAAARALTCSLSCFVNCFMSCFLTGLAAGYRLGCQSHDDLDTVPAGRQIVRGANDAIVSVDGRYRIVMANPAAAALFCTTVGNMVGTPLARYVWQAQS